MAAVIFAGSNPANEQEAIHRHLMGGGSHRHAAYGATYKMDCRRLKCDPIEYAVGLLNQQVWCWGRDV